MEIKEKLFKFKYHIIITLSFLVVITCILFIAPRFLTILAYFWPLFLSTALFLVAVVVFARTSPLPAAEVSAEKHGEGILDYVAGQQEQQELVECYNKSSHEEHDVVAAEQSTTSRDNMSP